MVGVVCIGSVWEAMGRGRMHMVGVDAEVRVGCTRTGWIHRFGVDAQGRNGCIGSGGMHKVGVDAEGRG